MNLQGVHCKKNQRFNTSKFSGLTENGIVCVANDTQISEIRIHIIVEQMVKKPDN